MRNLGKGQSVVFCIPQEIKIKILARSSKSSSEGIEVSDVLDWAISETYIEIRRSMPLWRAQGMRFVRQSEIWAEARNENNIRMAASQASKFLEKEAQSLDDRYRPRSSTDVVFSDTPSRNTSINLINERCRQFTGLDFTSATLQEEQERELSPEIEQERQVQRAAPAEPAKHSLHPDLVAFVATGILIGGSNAYKPAFQALHDTSAAAHLDVSQFPRDLYVTADFARTVKVSGNSYISDDFQRPVQWILTSRGNGSRSNNVTHMMVISPYEAQELLKHIKNSKNVTMHLYAPRQNQGFSALDHLALYSVPARLEALIIPRDFVVQLNVFAGQLYLDSFEGYVELCNFLDFGRDMNGNKKAGCTFSDSPVKFFKVLMTKIRRNCEGVDKTHMGKILDGRLFLRSDFEKSEDENIV